MPNPTFMFELDINWQKQMQRFNTRRARHLKQPKNAVSSFVGDYHQKNFKNVHIKSINKDWYAALKYYIGNNFSDLFNICTGWQMMKILHLCPFSHCGRVDMSKPAVEVRKKMYKIAQQVCKFYINII